jgi:hypothetical protein
LFYIPILEEALFDFGFLFDFWDFWICLFLRDYMNLIILDNSIVNYTTIIESLNIHTKYIILKRITDTYDTLKTKIADIGVTAFESVGIIQHNTNEPTYCLFSNISVPANNNIIDEPTDYDTIDRTSVRESRITDTTNTVTGSDSSSHVISVRDPIPESILLNVSERDPALETWTEYINFISFLKNTYHTQNLDLMACAIYSNKDWVYVIETLQLKIGLNIRASQDNTGSQNLGGNWFLETGGINLETTYFTENINKFNGLLNVITGFTGAFASWTATYTGSTTGGSVSNNSTTMTLISPNGGSGNGTVGAKTTIASNGTIAFSFSATTTDNDTLKWDPVGWKKNDVNVNFYDSGNNITGTVSVTVVATDTFEFFASSTDNAQGSSKLVITNFTFTPTAIAPILGSFDMTKTFGDSAFTITQPSSESSGAFTYSVSSGTGVISMSGTLITILSAGTATVTASQAASGDYTSATKDATIQINPQGATLSASQTIFYRKFVSGATVSFDSNNNISSNAGTVSRTYASNDTAIVTIPSSGTASATIAGSGKVTIKVTQPATTNYTQVISDLITIVVIGQGKTYSSETFPASFDLAGTDLTGTIFTSCTFTETNLFGITINSSTNFSNSTLTRIKSGRIIGKTSLLPAGFTMI